MSWLDKYLSGPLAVYAGGTLLATQPAINFGSGLTVTVSGGQYQVTAAGGGVGVGTAGQVLVTNSGASAAAWVSLSGDVSSVASGAVTVSSVHGASVPAGGSLTTGNVLQVTGAAALGYGPVNLAGGSAYVTGALPAANLPHGTAGQLLVTNAGATASAFVTLSQDATLTAAGLATVTQAQAGVFLFGAASGMITAAINLSGPGMTIAGQSGLSNVGQALSFTGQLQTGAGSTGGATNVIGGLAGYAGSSGSTSTGGNVNITGGAANLMSGAAAGNGGSVVIGSGAGSTANGTVAFQLGGTNVASFLSLTAGFGLSGLVFDAAYVAAGLSQATTSGTQHAMVVSAQNSTLVGGSGARVSIIAGGNTTTGGSGGNAVVDSGQGASVGLHGSLLFVIGGGTTVQQISPSGTNVANYETGFSNGSNVTVGSIAGSQATGTNVLSFVNGTAPTSTNYSVSAWASAGQLNILDSVSGLSVGLGGAGLAASTATFTISTSASAGGASSSPAAATLAIATASANVATSGTAVGGHGGDWLPTTGNGAAGLGGTSNGGRGGDSIETTGTGGIGVSTGTSGRGGNWTRNAGNGGAASSASGVPGKGGNCALNPGNGGNGTSTSVNGAGGDTFINTGAPGTGGSGNTALAGGVHIQNSGTDIINIGVNGVGFAPSSVSVAKVTPTLTLTQAQYLNRVIKITGTLTANMVIALPNFVGEWIFDLTSLLGAFTVGWTCGSSGSSATVTSPVAGNLGLVMVYCYGGNAVPSINA